MAVDLNATSIDPVQYSAMLGELQGNILKSHGRDYAFLILLKFRAGHRTAAKAFIRRCAADVTSASQQLADAALFDQSRHRIKGPIFVSLLFTAAGYRYFNIGIAQMDERFQGGMKAWAAHLQDSPENWDPEYQDDIHAMVLLAGDDLKPLKTKEREIVRAAEAVADVLKSQPGITLRNKQRDAIEHFGFVDGASNPVFLQKDVNKARAQGTRRFDPSAPLSLVLVPDPNGTTADSFGSYLVLRKLQQDVKAFKQSERHLAKLLALRGMHRARAGAMIMGRFKDGTPLAVASAPAGRDPVPNDFDYADDWEATRCPFQAHVRKMNTREQIHRSHRIARRGISYRMKKGSKEGGLLFMAFQSDIANQFEWLQMVGGNDRNFPDPHAGLDPLIGQGPSRAQEWPRGWGGPRSTAAVDIHALARVRGGEYFFAPSIGFLKALGLPVR